MFSQLVFVLRVYYCFALSHALLLSLEVVAFILVIVTEAWHLVSAPLFVIVTENGSFHDLAGSGLVIVDEILLELLEHVILSVTNNLIVSTLNNEVLEISIKSIFIFFLVIFVDSFSVVIIFFVVWAQLCLIVKETSNSLPSLLLLGVVHTCFYFCSFLVSCNDLRRGTRSFLLHCVDILGCLKVATVWKNLVDTVVLVLKGVNFVLLFFRGLIVCVRPAVETFPIVNLFSCTSNAVFLIVPNLLLSRGLVWLIFLIFRVEIAVRIPILDETIHVLDFTIFGLAAFLVRHKFGGLKCLFDAINCDSVLLFFLVLKIN